MQMPGPHNLARCVTVFFTSSWQCDQVMEFSWSALWNITDETPDNCEMFLNYSGMKLFLECLKVSAD